MKLFCIILTVLAIMGCTGRQGEGTATGADSLYTYTYIFRHHIQEPERCLALIDTAEMHSLMSADSCNWLRGHINYVCLNDYALADAYLRRVLDRPGLSHTSDVYLSALSTYCTFSLKINNNVRALEHAIEGARMAHEAGNARFEAEFYGIAGSAMEHEHPGAGIEYLDRAISLIRQQDDRQLLPKASYYLSEKARIQIEQCRYAEAAATCRERLALIDEMQQMGVFMTEGYFDMQQARTYAKLAMCLQSLGQTEEASQVAEAFDKTGFAKTISGKHDIMHYYVLTDDRQRVEQLCGELEDYYQQGDTISEFFRAIILEKAKWYRRHGEWHKADQASVRAALLLDSLTVRERDQQAAEAEVRFKTQEKELALAEAEAAARTQLIIIMALIAILAIGGIALWRIIADQRQLRQKNRELFDTVQQLMSQEEKAETVLKEQPEAMLTNGQKLYRKLLDLMRDKQPYTDCDLKREDLAQMLGTNYSYVADAIRECSGGMSLGDFLDNYRVLHAARLLSDTDEPIGVIIEMSGFSSRSHFNYLFRSIYKMTPSEYRKVAKEKK